MQCSTAEIKELILADLLILSCFSASGAGQGSIDNRIEQAMVSARSRAGEGGKEKGYRREMEKGVIGPEVLASHCILF